MTNTTRMWDPYLTLHRSMPRMGHAGLAQGPEICRTPSIACFDQQVLFLRFIRPKYPNHGFNLHRHTDMRLNSLLSHNRLG